MTSPQEIKGSPSFRQARYDEPVIFELPESPDIVKRPFRDAEAPDIPEPLRRATPPRLPELSEAQVVQHYVRLSQMNYGVDTGVYPLGSCTMKYNYKALEDAAADPNAANVHPWQDESTVQGALRIFYELQGMLATIAGMDEVTLQPAAGAHGEFTGVSIISAFHEEKGERDTRTEILLPGSAHGTNPASAAAAGYKVVEVPSTDGRVDVEGLKAAVSERTAGFMLTNPNTLGLFEKDVLEIAGILHDAGALLYYDGANLNAIMGKTTPGKMDFDIVHFNLHKTFGTPHGGGGPGSGPIGVVECLTDYLPVPIAARDGDRYYWDWDRPKSIGKVKAHYGNFGVILRAYLYILMMGGDGLERATERAVLNSNYLASRLKDQLELPYSGRRMHEFVLSGGSLKEKGLSTLNLAKRLLDYGYHAPTVYFPLIVEEALMVEPTEKETKETLDGFADAVASILSEDPELVKGAPYNTAVGKVDEVKAAKDLILTYWDCQECE